MQTKGAASSSLAQKITAAKNNFELFFKIPITSNPMQNTIINIGEIHDIFKEDCGEDNKRFSERKFQEFVDFLEIDFYDWVRGNFNQFHKQK